MNLGIILDVYFHCRKQLHEEEVDPVELEMYQAQTDQSVQRPLRVPNGRSPRRRRGSGVAGRGVSPSGVAAAGRARVEHDRPRARPGLAAVRRRPVFLVLVQRLVVSERGNPHARRWRASFLSFTVSAPVLWPLQPRRWASLEVLRERMDAVARGIHSAVIREASALVLKSFAHPAR